MLERLVGAGFFAVSIDPWQHGDRSTESPTHLRDRLIAAFWRDMWPVIGQSTLDAMWVLEWIAAHHDVSTSSVVAGGFSMGGDVSIALAGIDHRVGRVAASGRHLTGHAPACATWTPATATSLTKEPRLLTAAGTTPQLNPHHPPRALRPWAGDPLRKRVRRNPRPGRSRAPVRNRPDQTQPDGRAQHHRSRR